MSKIKWQNCSVTAFNVAFDTRLVNEIMDSDLKNYLAGKVSDPYSYKKSNRGQYFVITNLWYNLLLDALKVDEGQLNMFKFVVHKYGLLATIHEAKEFSSLFTNQTVSENESDGMPSCTIVDFSRLARNEQTLSYSTSLVFRELLMESKMDLSDVHDIRCIMEVLRFPSRFSPKGIDGYHNDAVLKFVEVQGQIKNRDRKAFPFHIIKGVRAIVSELLSGFRFNYDSPGFTSGSSRDATRTLASKVKALQEYDGRVLPESYSIAPRPAYNGSNLNDARIVDLGTVNKNYKQKRLIAPELVSTQYRAIGIKDELRRCIERYQRRHKCLLTCYENQDVNRFYALLGSTFSVGAKAVATIDFSMASDRISKSLILDVFPCEICKELEAVWPLHYIANNQLPKLMYSFSTMGNGITWDCMDVLFIALAIYTVELYCNVTRVKSSAQRRKYMDSIKVFGDDVIIHTDIAETFIDICNRLGLKVNVDKSFYNPDCKFRESCGGDYFCGFDISAKYWPRHDLSIEMDNDGNISASSVVPDIKDSYTGDQLDWISSIISLEHRLYEYPRCRNFLCGIIFGVCPSFTTSLPDNMEASDLWFPIESTLKKRVPGTDQEIEAHMHLEPKRVRYPEHTIQNWRNGLSLYYYYRFLKYGPRYSSPLDELLGVSEPLFSVADFGPRDLIWTI